MIIFTKFEVDKSIRFWVIALLMLMLRYLVTLWCLTFWPGQWSYVTGHVFNPSTKSEDPTPIRSWLRLCVVMSATDNVLAATAHAPYHVTCAYEDFFPHTSNPWPRFIYSRYNFTNPGTNTTLCVSVPDRPTDTSRHATRCRPTNSSDRMKNKRNCNHIGKLLLRQATLNRLEQQHRCNSNSVAT